MNQNLSLWERFKAKTPAFEKGAQIIFLILAAILGQLKGNAYIPHDVLVGLTWLSVGCAFFAQFGAEIETDVDSAIADPTRMLLNAPEIIGHLTDIKDQLQAITLPDATVDAISNTADKIADALNVAQQEKPIVIPPPVQ